MSLKEVSHPLCLVHKRNPRQQSWLVFRVWTLTLWARKHNLQLARIHLDIEHTLIHPHAPTKVWILYGFSGAINPQLLQCLTAGTNKMMSIFSLFFSFYYYLSLWLKWAKMWLFLSIPSSPDLTSSFQILFFFVQLWTLPLFVIRYSSSVVILIFSASQTHTGRRAECAGKIVFYVKACVASYILQPSEGRHDKRLWHLTWQTPPLSASLPLCVCGWVCKSALTYQVAGK